MRCVILSFLSFCSLLQAGDNADQSDHFGKLSQEMQQLRALQNNLRFARMMEDLELKEPVKLSAKANTTVSQPEPIYTENPVKVIEPIKKTEPIFAESPAKVIVPERKPEPSYTESPAKVIVPAKKTEPKGNFIKNTHDVMARFFKSKEKARK